MVTTQFIREIQIRNEFKMDYVYLISILRTIRTRRWDCIKNNLLNAAFVKINSMVFLVNTDAKKRIPLNE